MRGIRTTQQDIAIGHRVVSISRIAFSLNKLMTLESPEVERVVEIDEEARSKGYNFQVTLEGQNGRRNVIMTHTGFSRDSGRPILWSEPLPENDDEAIAFVAAAFMRGEGKRSYLFWVGQIGEAYAYCHLITDRHYAEENMILGEDMFYSPNAIPITLPSNIEQGMLIGIDQLNGTAEDGLIVHKPGNVQIVMRNKTLAQAAAIPTIPRNHSSLSYGNFNSMHDVAEQEELALARSEPSEALVLAWKDGDEQHVNVLGSTGIDFYRQDDIEIYVEGHIPGPGLWRFVNAKMLGYTSYEGEYDQDLDGDAIPADREAIRRHFGAIEALNAEIFEITGQELRFEDMIAKAVESKAEDDRLTEIHRLKMEAENAERERLKIKGTPATT